MKIESNQGHTQRISSYLRKRLPISIFAITIVLFTLPSPTLALPNIVFIMADDLGYGDLGCYGSAINETPNIDALAASGLRFTDFHSSGPMCTPTRVATLTGMYQQRFGPKFDGAISGVRDYDSGLPLEAITIAELLQENGYSTGCFGKWHLGYKPLFFRSIKGSTNFAGSDRAMETSSITSTAVVEKTGGKATRGFLKKVTPPT